MFAFLDSGNFDWSDYDRLPPAVQREADRRYAFCVSGRGHQAVQADPADPSVGIFGVHVWCDDCGMDLSDDGLLNPHEYERSLS